MKNYEIYLKGGLISVKNEIEITEKANSDEFFSLYIIAHKNPTLFQLLIANLSKTTEVYHQPGSASIFTSNFSIGQLQETISYQNAIISAYKEANKINNMITISYEMVGYVVIYTTNENLKTNDIIQTINNVDVTNWGIDDVYQYLNANDSIEVGYLDNGITKVKTITKNDQGKFGFTLDYYHKINDANPSYITKFENDAQIGPSGGLLQALSIYASLTEKRFNLKISGTGAIDVFGNIGPIGGVAQKIYTANNKVDIFFCPKANEEEALIAYNKIKNPRFELVIVESFIEAVNYLNEQD